MTSSALIAAVSAALASRVAAAGGVADIAESMDEAVAYLAGGTTRWRLILLWDGYGSHPAAREGMTTHQITAVIQQARGLPAAAGPKLLAFAERIEQVSAWIRAMRFPDGCEADQAGFSLADSRWLEAPKATRAHMLNFSLAAALPGFAETIPLVF
jgi:hypothetical protein